MYADDTHLTNGGQQSWECSAFFLNEDLANVFNWLQANHDQNRINANRVEAETEYSHSFTNN